MKTIRFSSILLLFICLLQACKKNRHDDSTSWSKFEINDSAWYSDRGKSHIIGDSLIIFKFIAGYYIEDDFFYKRSEINILSVPLRVGIHPLHSIPFSQFGEKFVAGQPFVLFSTFVELGEYNCSDYKVYAGDSLNNWLNIERQEDNFRKVWGSYSITMVKDTSYVDGSCTRNSYGDTVRIRNAKFYAETY